MRQIIADEGQLLYNAMMIDVFALLTEVRARSAANAAAIEDRRGFWIANTDRQFAAIGGSPSGEQQKVHRQLSPAPKEAPPFSTTRNLACPYLDGDYWPQPAPASLSCRARGAGHSNH